MKFNDLSDKLISWLADKGIKTHEDLMVAPDSAFHVTDALSRGAWRDLAMYFRACVEDPRECVSEPRTTPVCADSSRDVEHRLLDIIDRLTGTVRLTATSTTAAGGIRTFDD